jgi:hypothetical protein
MQATDLGEAVGQSRRRRHSPAAARPSQLWRPAVSLFLCAGLLVAGVWVLKHSPQSRIGPYGLIQALSYRYYVVMAGLLLSLVWTFGLRRYRNALLSAHMIALVILVHGAPGFIESEPRFETAWLTAGFTDYVAQAGRFLPQIDARFSWPAFFAGSAMVDKAAGLQTAISLIRWWPVALNLLYLPLIYRIAKEFLRTGTRAWIATAFFPLANWVGQDYYSPQSIAFLLYLAFIYLLIGPLGAHDRPVWLSHLSWRVQRRVLLSGRPWLRGRPSATGPPRSAPRTQESNATTVFYLVAVAVLMAAMALGHQLTPIIATGSAVVLALLGRTRVRWLVVAFALITFGWVCYAAGTFWSGHFSVLFGGVGSVQSNLGSAVLARLQGSFAHEFVVDVRVVTALVVWVAAAAGAVVWHSGRFERWSLLALFLVPFGMLAGGSYGGEAVLRVYLFTLPFAVCLMAVFVTHIRWPSRRVASFALLIILLPFFLVARWGNELYEMVRPAEVAGMEKLFQIAPPGSTLIAANPFLPWRFADVDTFHFLANNQGTFDLASTLPIVRLAESDPKGTFIIITTTQVIYGWQAYGLPRSWGGRVENMLLESPYFKLRFRNPDTEIFQYVPKPGSR